MKLISFLLIILVLSFSPASSNDLAFERWKMEFKQIALQNNISEKIFDQTMKNTKYLPVVYEASMEDIPVQGEGMDGIKKRKGFIIMEQLEPLPSEVARAMFVIGGGGGGPCSQIIDVRKEETPSGCVITESQYDSSFFIK